MAKLYYSLRIRTQESNYDLVSEILSIKPYNLTEGWIHEIENSGNEYFDFINVFLDILEEKFDKLDKIGVYKKDITIWLIYEYNDQCNLEFQSKDLKRLGENEISLCLSCYEGGYE
jgi:hypothetical protein